MNMYMYMSADGVDVTIGSTGIKPKIKSCEKFGYTKDAYINNVITDREEFSRVLKLIHDKYKKYTGKVHLIISGTQILTKMMMLPNVSEKTLMSMAKKEMSNINNYNDDMIFDYTVIDDRSGSNKRSLLFAAISREFYNEIITSMRGFGFAIKDLSITEEVLVRIGRYLAQTSDEPIIMAVLDGKNLIMCYYLHGRTEYTTKLRLLSERDTTELFDEIIKHTRAVYNYTKTKYPDEQSVQRMYICGVHDTWKEKGIVIINDALPFECQLLSDKGRLNTSAKLGENLLCDHTYTVGNIL